MGSPLLGIRQSTHRWSANLAPADAQTRRRPQGPRLGKRTRWNPATSPLRKQSRHIWQTGSPATAVHSSLNPDIACASLPLQICVLHPDYSQFTFSPESAKKTVSPRTGTFQGNVLVAAETTSNTVADSKR